jgi:hypothetical protein
LRKIPAVNAKRFNGKKIGKGGEKERIEENTSSECKKV